jgi:hypothetical protein
MIYREQRPRPPAWAEYCARGRTIWVRGFLAFEWLWEWTAYGLSNWAFLEVLEYLGTFSVLIAVVFYFAESGDRRKQKHYQAWQVINTAQGKGGSGGRIEALQELNSDRVPLVGVDVSGAFLQGLRLDGAHLARANFNAADVRNGSFRSAHLSYANLASANIREGDLRRADLSNASLDDADLSGADLSAANLDGASLDRADLRYTNLRSVRWQKIAALKLANIYGIKAAPAGFVDWAKRAGALAIESDDQWLAALDTK